MSRYSPDAPYTVYCPKCWWGDGWDGFEYGREYDFSRPFFEQFNELFKEAPLLALSLDIPATENSPFCNHAGELKDCYLLFDSGYVENGMIGFGVNKSTDILDSGPILECNNLYDCMHTYKSSNCVGTRSQVAECI
ncbi:hypothetical protein KC727_02415 [Candidatus Kaiserbacteria bacterium]|nr:hypothetical protein [Candidatus Kaiserbacteria bacterium]